MTKKRIWRFCLSVVLAGTAALLGVGSGTAQAAQAGEWELTDDGKNWQYLYSWDDPAKDEWIEDEGKIYYLDSKGYMKTGWVTNKEDGKRYYMGPDGAMCFNMFSEDDKYVGADGTRVERYDKYRKAIRSELKKSAPKKVNTTSSRRTKTQSASQGESEIQQFFLLTDLNGDDYRDLVVMEGLQEAAALVKVMVWSPEDEKFQLSAEFDRSDSGQGTLYLDPDGEGVWLEMTQTSGEMSLFQMEFDTSVFENVWTFTLEPDDEGVIQFCINGNDESREDWELAMVLARQKRGNQPVTGYLPATEENLSVQIDRILSAEELGMWE